MESKKGARIRTPYYWRQDKEGNEESVRREAEEEIGRRQKERRRVKGGE